MSEYKAALIRVGSEYAPEIGILDASGQRWYVAGPRLGSQHGWYADRTEVVRPLVVIDPEDREAVERFRLLASRWADRVPYADMAEPGDMDHTDAMQAALREFANPKPPEPTGLGAVVEDAQGNRWVRNDYADHQWQSRDFGIQDYSRIDAVCVLSEGVTS